LNQEDFLYKIPYIQMANASSGGQLNLYASPWSAPGWMKNSGMMKGGGHLIGEVNGPYYQTWANYFVRFFEEYYKNNITFWGATMENEASSGSNTDWYFEAMFMNTTMQRDFAKGYWGQMLRNNPVTQNLKLMVLDDIRCCWFEDIADIVYGDTDANNVVDGIALHWYNDGQTTPELITQVHEKYPDKFLFYTEACQSPPSFGTWSTADNYMHYVIPILNNWVVGWMDWNMALDYTGGPGSQLPTILVSNSTDEFEKQPQFYAMGHLAKFFPPGSVIIGLNFADFNTTNLEAVAAINPSGQKVVLINNRDVATTYNVSIYNSAGSYINLSLEPRSFTNVIYN